MDDGEIVRHSSSTCTHVHTCNNTPAASSDAQQHTHTCYHTHTRVVFSSKDDVNSSSLKPKTPLGNREAVRKYREKKKAHTAFLEAEVKKLRDLNQQLVRRVQVQDALEAEISSLRALLGYIRGKVGAELGCLPVQKQCGVADSRRSFDGCTAIDLQFPVQTPSFARNLITDAAVGDLTQLSEAVERSDTGNEQGP